MISNPPLMKSQLPTILTRFLGTSLCLFMICTWAVASGDALFSYTGSQHLSDLETVLFLQSDSQSPFADQRLTTEDLDRNATRQITSANSDQGWNADQLLFVDYDPSGEGAFQVRLMRDIAPNTTIAIANVDLGQLSSDQLPPGDGAIVLRFGEAYSCGHWFSFSKEGGTWQYVDARSSSSFGEGPGDLLVKGSFNLGGEGARLYAFAMTGPIFSSGNPEDADSWFDKLGEMIKSGTVGQEDDAEVECQGFSSFIQLEDQGEEVTAPKVQAMKAPPTDCSSGGEFVGADFCTSCGSCSVTSFDNPDADSECNDTRMLLILDESGSINSTEGAEVESGVNALMQNLNCKGVEIGVIEFARAADFVLDTNGGYRAVNNAVVDAIEDYFDDNNNSLLAQSDAAAYRDNSLGAWTNYQSAFLAAYEFASNYGAPDIILFFTDGVPNHVFLSNTPIPDYDDEDATTNCGDGNVTSYNNATIISNYFKCQETHVFTAAVSGASGTTAVTQVSGPTQYSSGSNTILNSDFSIGDFDDLADDFTDFVNQLCDLQTTVDDDDLCTNETTASVEIDIPAELINPDYTWELFKNDVSQGSPTTSTDDPLIIGNLGAGDYDVELVFELSDGCVLTETQSFTVVDELCCDDPVFTCPPDVTLGCEELGICITFEEFGQGDCVEEVSTNIGDIGVFGSKSGVGGANGVRIFDTSDPHPEDPDLGSPNEEYGGPGVGVGGEPGVYANEIPIGNIIIVNREESGQALPYPYCGDPDTSPATDPNDEGGSSAYFIFDFKEVGPVNMEHMVFIDTEEGAPTATFYDADDNIIYGPDLLDAGAGDNGVILTDLTSYTGVSVMRVDMQGSGGIDEICLTRSDSPGEPTVEVESGCPDVVINYHEDEVTGDLCTGLVRTRTWYAHDEEGTVYSCQQTITYIDNDLPEIDGDCPTDMTVQCNDDVPDAAVLTAKDTCGDAIVEFDEQVKPGICGDTIIRTWTPVDDCGNEGEPCVQTIYVIDTEPPLVSCPADKTVECFSEVDYLEPTATDNCTPVEELIITDLGQTTTTDSCGLLTVTQRWRVTDCNNNSKECSQVVKFVDTTPPVPICADDKTVECDEIWSFDAPTGSDNCGGDVTVKMLSTTYDTTDCGTGDVTRKWRLSDCTGNSVDCSQVVTIVDTKAPEVTCPADATVECFTEVDYLPPTASDNCTPTEDLTITNLGQTTTTDSCGLLTVTQRWRVTDCNDNSKECSQVVKFIDTTPPVPDCADDKTVECDEVWSFDTPTGSDNCDGPVTVKTLSTTYDTTDCGTGDVTRKWRLSDCTGNSVECSQEVTIVDTKAPEVTCPADATVECFTEVDYLPPTASDNCSPTEDLTITNLGQTTTEDSCGLLTVTQRWRVTDCNNNSKECSQVVKFIDTTPPVPICADDKTVECDEIWSFDAPTGSDNCGGDVTVKMLSTTYDTTDCGTGDVTRKWRLSDCTGNSVDCSQVVTIVDTKAPEVTCPADATVECFTEVDYLPPTASDNCTPTEDLTITNLGQTTTTDSCGLLTVTQRWRVTDCNDNSKECSQVVKFIDTTPPVPICADDKTVECDEVWSFDTPTGSDNCDGPVTVKMLSTTYDTTDCGTGDVTRKWRLSDCTGNSVECSQVVTIVDTKAPEVTCPADATVECFTEVDYLPPTASDNCTPTEDLTITNLGQTTTEDSCGLLTVTQRWRVTDCSDNSKECSQVVKFIDTTPPVPICADDKTVECDEIWSFDAPTGSDNCGGDVTVKMLSTTYDTTDCGTGDVTRKWRLSDCTGNSVDCSQVVTIVDTKAPEVTCPADATVECFTEVDYLPPTASDNCTPTEDLTITNLGQTTTTDSCGLLTVTQRWRVTDCNDNSKECSQVVKFIDTTPPVPDCADDKTVECDEVWSFDTPTGSDNCDGPVSVKTLSTSYDTTDCGTGDVTRKWRLSDCTGNSVECSQVVTIVDTKAPEVTCPADATVECFTEVDYLPPTASDNCTPTEDLTITNLGQTTTEDSCGLLTVTQRWRVTDCSDNSKECSQVVKFIDTTPPVPICADDKTVECDESWSFDAPTGSDNCGGDVTVKMLSTTYDTTDCGTGDVTRKWRLSDCTGNSVDCSQVVTIVDTKAPEVTCPADATVECFTEVDYLPPTASDNCTPTEDLTITNLGQTTTTDSCGLLTVTQRWRVTDCNDNSKECSQVVKFIDTTPPVPDCADDKTVECDEVWSFDTPTGSDNCDGPVTVKTLSTTYDTTDCGTGDVTRKWRLSDCTGNSVECSQVVTIVDTKAPEVTCPADATVECFTEVDYLPPTASDNCTPTEDLTITNLGQTTTEDSCGLLTVTQRWRVTDCSDNSKECSQVVKFIDTTPPVPICADDKTVECDEIWSFDAPTGSDNCGGDVTVKMLSTTYDTTDCGTGDVTRKWRLSDCTGNSVDCSQVVTIVDTKAPEVTCPADATVECYTEYDYLPPTASDNCTPSDELTVTDLGQTESADSCGLLTITQRWRVTDCSGNSKDCSQVVKIVDTTPPVPVCADDKTVECDDIWSFDAPTGADNCDGPVTVAMLSTTYDTTDCGTGDVTRKWSLSDCTGNSVTCSQVVTIVDTQAPEVSCPDDQTVECFTEVDFEPPTASDNCTPTGDLTITDLGQTESADSCGLLTITQRWRVTDCSDNSKECSQVIKIVDNTPPSPNCADDKKVECDEAWSFDAPTGSDNCDGPIAVTMLSTTYDTSDCGTGTVTRKWRLSDCTGNSADCSQVVTVVDTKAPDVTCPADATVECFTEVDYLPPTASDNCTPTEDLTITNLGQTTTTDSCGLPTVTQRWRVTDCSDNSAECSQVVKFVDTTPPKITCLADVTIGCGVEFDFEVPEVDDTCDPGPITIVDLGQDETSDSCGLMTITQYWKAIDCSGNEATCSQVVVIADTSAPVLSCPADATLQCGDPISFAKPTVIDDCFGPDQIQIDSLEQTDNRDVCGVGTISQKWRATDCSGNSITCVQTITVIDTLAPILACPGDTVVDCFTEYDFMPPTATDNCTEDGEILIEDLGLTESVDACGLGYIIQTWKATDCSGNSTICSQRVDFIDTIPPTITCADDLTIECNQSFNPEENEALGDWLSGVGASITDNCCDNGVDSTTYDIENFEIICGASGFQEVTFYVSDGGGNTATCKATLFVVDIEPPVLICNDTLFIECGESLDPAENSSLDDWLKNPATLSDNCSQVLELTDDYSMGGFSDGCGNTGMQEVTFTATDECDSVATCTAIIMIIDTTPPVMVCPDSILIGCSDEIPPPDPESIEFDDECDSASVVVEHISDTYVELDLGCEEESVIRVYRATDACGNTSECVQIIGRSNVVTTSIGIVELDLQVMLYAALNEDSTGMTTTLNSILPLEQPYFENGYSYAGSEMVTEMDSDIVDWLLVKLRDPDTEAIGPTQAVLLRSDGQVMDVFGDSLVTFAGVELKDWEVVICHRNHLDILTDVALDLSGGFGTFNFMDDWTGAPTGMRPLGGTSYAMHPGDANANNKVSYLSAANDRTAILTFLGGSGVVFNGYSPYDVNFDGIVRYLSANNDRNALLIWLGGGGEVVNGQLLSP